MKGFTILFILFSYSIGAYGQAPENKMLDKKEQRQLAKEYRQAEKRALELQKQKITADLIKNRRFVLKAEYLSGRSGSRHIVSSNLNFIIIDSSEATIQIGSNYGIGYNGVGGITVDGNITKFESAEDITKHGKNYIMTIHLNSNLGQYDIFFRIYQNGNADATIRGNYSGSISYSGNITSIRDAKIYKASPI